MAGPFPCSNPPNTCETNPNPATGFSSEAEDSTTFIALAWNNQPPALGAPFTATPCEAIAESQISQADADRIAANQAVICSNPCASPIFNAAQTASALCSDGNPYSFTVPAGLFSAENQVLADRKAFTAAVAALNGKSVCLGSVAPASVCRGEFYFGIISLVSNDTPITTELVEGDLPEGLAFAFESTRVVIQGTPLTFGSAQFTLRSTSASGIFTSRQYTVYVTGIVTSSLNAGTQGVDYSAQLTASVPEGSEPSWSISAGTLPDGLVLDTTTGLISGNPTTVATSNFTVSVTTAGHTCSRDFSINVVSGSITPACIAPLTDFGLNADLDWILVGSRSATTRLMAVQSSSAGYVQLIDSSTNTIIATTPCTPEWDQTGEGGCFATSTGEFYLQGTAGCMVFNSSGTLVATIAPPASSFWQCGYVYSPTQDRVYGVAFSNINHKNHIIEINPHTHAITNDVTTTFAAFPVIYYASGPDLVILHPTNDYFYYSLPALAFVGDTFINNTSSVTEIDYATNTNRLFCSLQDGAMVSINPATFAIDFTYTPISNFYIKSFVKYNPVTGVIIAAGFNGEITVIDPVAQTILCEFTIPDTIHSIAIDYSSGDVYFMHIDSNPDGISVYH